jgi:hypothetical protein
MDVSVKTGVNIYITESHIGNHTVGVEALSKEVGKTEILAFTFRPAFYTITAEIESPTTQTKVPISNKNALFYSAMSNYQMQSFLKERDFDIIDFIMYQIKETGLVFLGQDADAAGQLMASLIFWHLVDRGIEPRRILRTPLMDVQKDGTTIGFTTSIYSKLQLCNILEAIRLEQVMMHQFGTKLGYRNLLALKAVEEYRGKKIKRLSQGTSTATYLTKYALGER